jgi:RNA polymerase sigma factor (sigma-70 family)
MQPTERHVPSLFEANLPWAFNVARSARWMLPPSFDVADLEQAARIEHWKRSMLYDPSTRVPYQAYAYMAVRGAVLMACRRREYREATHEPLKDNRVDERPRPDDALIAREEWRNRTGPRERRRSAKLQELLGELPAADAYLVRRLCIDGADVNSLARTWSATPERIRKRLSLAMRALKRAVRNGRSAGR